MSMNCLKKYLNDRLQVRYDLESLLAALPCICDHGRMHSLSLGEGKEVVYRVGMRGGDGCVG